jgi:hypothetical protein
MILRRVLPTIAVLLLAGPVHAGRTEEAARMLQDGNYKVRVQAALVLGRLGDPAAFEPLSRALQDPNKSVRAVAAQSLGKLGSPDAVPALQALLRREQDAFVRAQTQRAIAALGPAPAEGEGHGDSKKIYLAFGSFGGGARAADAGALEIVRQALRRELGKLSSVTFTVEKSEEKSFARSGRLGFLIDGNVTRLEDANAPGAETSCDVKVVVARWPARKIILFTNAGAAVQSGARPQDRENARRECLEASAGQLGEDLSKFLQSQGG